jgi:hypothetical protein
MKIEACRLLTVFEIAPLFDVMIRPVDDEHDLGSSSAFCGSKFETCNQTGLHMRLIAIVAEPS